MQLNFLNTRFDKRNETAWPELEKFPSSDTAIPFIGSMTIWESENLDSQSPRLLAHYEPEYKVQSSTFMGDKLVILGATEIEVLSHGFKRIRLIKDKWLAGAHSIAPIDDRYAWVTSATADALLKFDIKAGCCVKRLRLPKSYGQRYDLREEHSTVQNYIPTDYQNTHINNVFIDGEDLIVTLWIQGIVAKVDLGGKYTELIQGFRGLHGARRCMTSGELYFSDTTSGMICFLDSKSHQIKRRVDCNSDWLHDAIELDEDKFAASIGDRNEISIVNSTSGKELYKIDCSRFGGSVNLLNTSNLPLSWMKSLDLKSREIRRKKPQNKITPNLYPTELLAYSDLIPVDWSSGAEEVRSLVISSKQEIENEIFSELSTAWLSPGHYKVCMRGKLQKGSCSFGVISHDRQKWIVQENIDFAATEHSLEFQIDRSQRVVLVLAGSNHYGANFVNLSIQSLQAYSSNEDIQFHIDRLDLGQGVYISPLINFTNQTGFAYVATPIDTIALIWRSEPMRLSEGDQIICRGKLHEGTCVFGLMNNGVAINHSFTTVVRKGVFEIITIAPDDLECEFIISRLSQNTDEICNLVVDVIESQTLKPLRPKYANNATELLLSDNSYINSNAEILTHTGLVYSSEKNDEGPYIWVSEDVELSEKDTLVCRGQLNSGTFFLGLLKNEEWVPGSILNQYRPGKFELRVHTTQRGTYKVALSSHSLIADRKIELFVDSIKKHEESC